MMKESDIMIDFIIRYWLEVFFALITSLLCFGYRMLAQKIKESNKKQEAIEEGIQALLRDRIIRAYNHYIEKGFLPIYAHENIEELYNQYHALGGNGTITKLIEKLRELPTDKE